MQLTPRFSDALTFAADLHRDQLRKGGDTPYVAHLLAVCALVLENGGSEDEAIAALLHDAAEDQGGAPTLDAVRRRFGDNVAAIVDGCSDTLLEPKPDWWTRKRAYIEHLAGASPSILLVSLCDKVHNARAILADYRIHGEALWLRFRIGREGTLWYYGALVEAFREAGVPVMLVKELARTIAEIQRLRKLKTPYDLMRERPDLFDDDDFRDPDRELAVKTPEYLARMTAERKKNDDR